MDDCKLNAFSNNNNLGEVRRAHAQLLLQACIKDGYLMKQTSSFQRWRKRYFKLKNRKLYYAKDTKSVVFDEIDLNDVSVAECSTKNVNHSFQVITPFRCLVVCADTRRDMEEWIGALRAAGNRDFYEGGVDHHDFMSGQHNWYAASHARPTYCNVCREALPGVTSHGLSCEVCKLKAHKRCAAKMAATCKWTTLASVGRDIIEDEDGNITMRHQWVEGNLPVSAKCAVCERTCGSVLRLQDWRCLWCRSMVHTACRPALAERCPLGPCRSVSVVPPTALHCIGTDDAWEATRPTGCSPLLVFVNSKSGDNQGVRFLRRFKQLLNPAQVFDLMNGGPGLGLRLFKTFDPFRILVCGGDGSVGWVLSELDKVNMHKQCQLGVLPLGTGNDLARVLGWGSVCDDDTLLPQLLDKYEKASTKMLDRWSIMTYEGTVPRRTVPQQPIAAYEDSVVAHLTKILHSTQHSIVLSSAKVLCETVRDFVTKVGAAYKREAAGIDDDEEDSIAKKCAILDEKLNSLLQTLNEETGWIDEGTGTVRPEVTEPDVVEDEDDGGDVREALPLEKPDKEAVNHGISSCKNVFTPKEALMSRANSLKKAVRQIIEHAERAVDEQNAQSKPTFRVTSAETEFSTPEVEPCSSPPARSTMLQVLPTIESVSGENSPCPSPLPFQPEVPEESPTTEPEVEKQDFEGGEKGSPVRLATRRISCVSAVAKHASLSSVPVGNGPISSLAVPTASKTVPKRELPIISPLSSLPIWNSISGGSMISKVLLANADALCAAASPLMDADDDDDETLDGFDEKCVMNNYFGIGLDAKITLDFHNKREEHPEKCRSRTKNFMWYGVLGGKELLQRTYRNLEQKVLLECDGRRISLPSLQGIVVLNIPSFAGGTNFWGGTKDDDPFLAQSFDDKILEVVAVFGSVQMAASRLVNLHRHRIAQCRAVKITVLGDEGVPVQVDGEAWLQPPGVIRIVHKNRAQMLSRNRHLESTLRAWEEKQQRACALSPPPLPPMTSSTSGSKMVAPLSDEECQLFIAFADVVGAFLVTLQTVENEALQRHLHLLVTQTSAQLESLFPEGRLIDSANRAQVTELVGTVRQLHSETTHFLHENDVFEDEAEAEKLSSVLNGIEAELRKWGHDEKKRRSLFKLMFNKRTGTSRASVSSPEFPVQLWGTDEVCQWLESIHMGEYRENFVRHDVRGAELLNLERRDFKDLGISKVGHVKRILQAVKDMPRGGS